MKRCVLRIFVCLLLGAIVNVAVAWGLVLAVDPTKYDRGVAVNGESHMQWEGRRWSQRGAVSVLSMWTRYEPSLSAREGAKMAEIVPSWAPNASGPPAWLATSQPGEFATDIVDARGWPLLSLLSCAQVWNADVAEMHILAGIECHWLPSRSAKQMFGHTLPTHPILPGFVTNTVFYAAILWLPFGAFALRRRRRIERGLCPKCAYDLRGSTGGACPECGARE